MFSGRYPDTVAHFMIITIKECIFRGTSQSALQRIKCAVMYGSNLSCNLEEGTDIATSVLIICFAVGFDCLIA